MLVNFNSFNKSAEIKALAFDLDGTLLAPGSVLTDRTLRAVRVCAEKGLRLILCTGRAVVSAEKFRVPMGADGPMVYFNGAIIAEMPGEKILHTTLLSKEIALACLDISIEKKVYYQVYIPGAKGQPLLANEHSIHGDNYCRATKINADICDLGNVLADPEIPGCIKGMYIAEPEVLDDLRPVIERRFGNSVYAVRSTNTFLEILNPGVSKGLGLELALKHLGIRPAEAVVFGDEENDLPMFSGAGFSVAPANAKEKVKAAADFVTLSNSEDGVAVFLEEYFC